MPDNRGSRAVKEPTATAFAKYIDSIVPAMYPTQAALARAVGVSTATVSRWRNGMTPQLPALYALARVTGISLETLFQIAGYGRPPSGRDTPSGSEDPQ